MRLSPNTVFTLLFLGLCILNACTKEDSKMTISGEGVFTSSSDNAIIEGELFLPEGNGLFPLMIIVPGSGNEPRQELEIFADILNNEGYALYLYDKRGIGGSTGSYPIETPNTATEFLTARAEDVLGILELLKSHEQIDSKRMGVMGSSQGAWVNSIVYSKSMDLSYVVMASGGVASTGIEGYYCSLTNDPNISIEEAINQLPNYNGPIGFDPIEIIKTITLPVLWIYGNEDRSHPARYDVNVLNDLNKDNFSILVIPNTSHDLLDVITGQIPETLIPSLGQWLEDNN